MKIFLNFLLLFFYFETSSQELFVVTEPASNLPKGAIFAKLSQSFFKKNDNTQYNVMPEIGFGISKSFQMATNLFFNTFNQGLKFEGFSLYSKIRLLSEDDLHRHFRIATFGRISFVNTPVEQEQIETMGFNSGLKTGFIFTKLIKRTAISSSIAYEKAFDNHNNKFPTDQNNNALDYTFSIGVLVYPKKYLNFNQPNINVMVEAVGQTLFNGKTYLDIVPSIQCIIHSQARVDFAYRAQMINSMERTTNNIFYLNFGYTFF